MNFGKEIIRWYLANKRDLPWRETRDPYRIWLSEVILQQTRVDQGMAYYHKFVKNYPTVQDLAQSSENQVLKDWQGLGYYSRARNLHFAAKQVVNDYKGNFPENAAEISKLKGVGPYTAAAIASFAFDECAPVIDGNVMRVLSRYFGITEAVDSKEGQNLLKRLAEENISRKEPATYNQAIMEFGALQCVPKNPDCSACPLSKSCVALQQNMVGELPWKSKKTKVQTVHIYYGVFEKGQEVLFRRRKGLGIWEGLYDFPAVESQEALTAEEALRSIFQKNKKIEAIEVGTFTPEMKHILSHRKLMISFIRIKVMNKWNIEGEEGRWVKKSDIHELGIPRAIERYLQEIGWYE
ncbi:MAG: A/G-specific adenine glycosylase [Flavobacteriales bacterium]